MVMRKEATLEMARHPAMPEELIVALSKRYIKVYEMLTGKKFTAYRYPIEDEIKRIVEKLDL